MSVFITDDFLTELKTPPLIWIGPELTRRILSGKSPLLSDKQVRQANARGGLNLLTWIGAFNADYLQSADSLAA